MNLARITLIAWSVYMAIIVASSIQYGLSAPIYSFGLIAVAGLASGIWAVRGLLWWRWVAAVAAFAFLALTVTRYVYFVTSFMNHYPSLGATVNQYLVEQGYLLRRAVDERSFISYSMHAYHEWLMPLLQLGILIALIRMLVNERANSSLSGRAEVRRSTKR